MQYQLTTATEQLHMKNTTHLSGTVDNISCQLVLIGHKATVTSHGNFAYVSIERCLQQID